MQIYLIIKKKKKKKELHWELEKIDSGINIYGELYIYKNSYGQKHQ